MNENEAPKDDTTEDDEDPTEEDEALAELDEVLPEYKEDPYLPGPQLEEEDNDLPDLVPTFDWDEKHMNYYAEFSNKKQVGQGPTVYLLDSYNLPMFEEECEEKFGSEIRVLPLAEQAEQVVEKLVRTCLYGKPEQLMEACAENWDAYNGGEVAESQLDRAMGPRLVVFPTDNLVYYVVLRKVTGSPFLWIVC